MIFAPLWFPASVIIICFAVISLAIKFFEKGTDNDNKD